MPRYVEPLAFDSKLFNLNVGRIDLDEKEVKLLNQYPSLHDILGSANSSGYRLVYLMYPPDSTLSRTLPLEKSPGNLVDWKSTYYLNLSSLDGGKLCHKAFQSKGFKIRPYSGDATPPSTLLDLAVTSGTYSRFCIDLKIPRSGYEGMFHAWLKNSINKSVADEVFVAYDSESQQEIGFITVKRKQANVNIGLLSVHQNYRRLGVASSLLSRAALWALEQLGDLDDATMSVITQGTNSPACACYERFGFNLTSLQAIYHVWLPDDLSVPSRSDQDPIPFCRQHFSGKELSYAQHLLSTGLDSNAHYHLMCSMRIKDILGDDPSRVLVVPSGTAALEMAALLCDLEPGDEVIMPSYTFSSTANAFVLRRAVPVFVDVREDTLNIDETLIEAAISERTKAICVVHYAGVPCEMDTICAIAKKHNLLVIEDAAQAFMSQYKGRQVGSIGDIGCFSFHYTKNVNCGEGGAISINRNEHVARRAMIMWEKGTNRHDFLTGVVNKYEWIDIGSSYVPSELSCAVLWAQLEDSEKIFLTRRQHFQTYSARLSELETRGKFKIGCVPTDCLTNGHIFYLIFPTDELAMYYENGLKESGISVFSHYIPLHSSQAGLKFGRVGSDLTITNNIWKRLLRLPMWTDLQEYQLNNIVNRIVELGNALDGSSNN